MATPELSNGTKSILATQNFLNQFLTLNESDFIKTLDDKVTAVFTRVNNGCKKWMKELNSKKEIVKFYNEKFFAVTNRFHLVESRYAADDLTAKLYAWIYEQKKEEGSLNKYYLVCQIQLDFIEAENGELKIAKIWDETSKNILKS